MTREQFKRKCDESDRSWGDAHRAFRQVVVNHGLRRGVEVGTGYGGHAALLLPHVDELIGVDPFRHDPDYTDGMNVEQGEFDDIHDHVVWRLRDFWNYQHLRMSSREAAPRFAPGSIDFVFIDGDHREAAVREDLRLWTPIVRVGGIIAGHDFEHPSHPGVARAVREFAGDRVNLEPGYVWWVKKETTR